MNILFEQLNVNYILGVFIKIMIGQKIKNLAYVDTITGN